VLIVGEANHWDGIPCDVKRAKLAGMDGDLPSRAELARQVRDLDERLLILEAQLRQPMSIADRMLAEATAKRRYEARFPRPLDASVLKPDRRNQR
jgi:hypothetical protein